MIALNNTVVFIDTNVIAYSHDIDSPFYGTAYTIIGKVFSGDYSAYISTQILSELYRTLTKSSYLYPLDSEEAWLQIRRYYKSELVKVLPITNDVFRVLIKLGKKYPVIRGRNVFDMQIVATMLNYGIDTIITANEKDFAIYEPEGIKVINPFK